MHAISRRAHRRALPRKTAQPTCADPGGFEANLRVTLNALALPRDAQSGFRIAFMALRLRLIAPLRGDLRYAHPTDPYRAADRTTRRFVVRSRLDGYAAERRHPLSFSPRYGREIPRPSCVDLPRAKHPLELARIRR